MPVKYRYAGEKLLAKCIENRKMSVKYRQARKKHWKNSMRIEKWQ